jgi:hypothetical protein
MHAPAARSLRTASSDALLPSSFVYTYGGNLGVSLRTHELYLLTFCCRYLDLFTLYDNLDLFTWYFSLYNSAMKLFHIGACIAVIYAMRCRIASTYDVSQDTFRHWIAAAAPCGVLALVTHVVDSSQHGSFLMELLWTFSIYLEVMAIVPQLIVFQRYQNIDLSLRNYIFSWAPTGPFTFSIGSIGPTRRSVTGIIGLPRCAVYYRRSFTSTLASFITCASRTPRCK